MASRARGFTLIELLTVITIIAVMSVVVVPAYQKLVARTNFDSVVANVVSLFGEARTRAVSKGEEDFVAFDRSSMSFILVEQPPLPQMDQPVALTNSSTPNSSTTQLPPPVQSQIVMLGRDCAVTNLTPGSGTGTFPSSSSSSGSQTQIHFNDDGTCDGAQLTLISSNGYTAMFQLSPATGRLKRVDNNGQ